MLPEERRAVLALALIYMVRMLGLFVILPVFSLFAVDYTGSTPFLIGLALGIYGLFQALLQIPFGLMSDRIGRKRTIAIGLLLMLLGSVIAALSESIYGVILGRALQGAGAIAAALMALAADLSRDSQRTKMMAGLGASIGMSFLLALILGPVLITFSSISLLFWFSALTSIAAMVILYTVVPNPKPSGFSADTSAQASTVRQLLKHRQLLRLDVSVFFLHLLITATFVAVPLLLRDSGIAKEQHWQVYLTSMLLSLLIMLPMLVLAERFGQMRKVVLAGVLGMLVVQLLFASVPSTTIAMFVAVTFFFGFLNTLESLFPSLLTRIAPAGSRGSATGIYSSSQFFGAFVGGAGGGLLLGMAGYTGLFLGMAAVCAVWLALIWGFQAPRTLGNYRYPLSGAQLSKNAVDLHQELSELPGVAEVVLALEEQVAYMKVDKSQFQPLAP